MVLFNGVSHAHLISVTIQWIVELTNMVSHSFNTKKATKASVELFRKYMYLAERNKQEDFLS